MIEIEQLASKLVNLTIKDVNELSKILKNKYGINPTPKIDSTKLSNESDNLNSKKEEKSIFDVMLRSPGSTKLKVIKTVKEILGKTLTDSKNLVDSAPDAMLKKGANKKEAEELKKQFENIGAEIELI